MAKTVDNRQNRCIKTKLIFIPNRVKTHFKIACGVNPILNLMYSLLYCIASDNPTMINGILCSGSKISLKILCCLYCIQIPTDCSYTVF